MATTSERPELAYASAPGRWVLAATVLGASLAFLDLTVVNLALPTIGRDLDAGFSGLAWTVNAYALTLSSLILFGGSLGDLLGRRRIYVIGVVWFAVASRCLRAGADGRGADRGARAAGRGCGAAHAWQPRDHRGDVPERRSRRGDRRLVRARRHRWRRRPVPRRLPVELGLAGVRSSCSTCRSRWRSSRSPRASMPETRKPGARPRARLRRRAARHARARRRESTRSAAGPATASPRRSSSPSVASGCSARGVLRLETRVEHPMLPLGLFCRRSSAQRTPSPLRSTPRSRARSSCCRRAAGARRLLPLESGAALVPTTVVMLLLSPRAGALAQRIGPRLPLTAARSSRRRACDPHAHRRERELPVDVLPAVLVWVRSGSRCSWRPSRLPRWPRPTTARGASPRR